nr:hypothetical protein [Haloplanus rubicundus]
MLRLGASANSWIGLASWTISNSSKVTKRAVSAGWWSAFISELLAAIDAGKISEQTADKLISTWVDEIGYYVPYRDIAAYR